jgi:23S rRNA (pseudouridine1915-N3)-methyltransferase
MPSWVSAAFEEYTRRLAARLPLCLVQIAVRAPTAQMREEGRRILAALDAGEFVAALDERGTQLSTRELAAWLQKRKNDGRNVVFVIGGADGLAPEVKQRADFTWSLSRLTLPHALVRVVLAEQLYRATSLLANHPYHRD